MLFSQHIRTSVIASFVSLTLIACGSSSDGEDPIETGQSNKLPVVNAGQDVIVFPNEVVELNGTASDADGDTLSYKWTLTETPSGSIAELDDTTSLNTHFIPDLAGEYIAQLIADDGKGQSLADTITITVNTVPVARVEGPASVQLGEVIALDASTSFDADNDVLTYHWTISVKPENSVVNITLDNASTSMLTPDIVGEYHIQLIVSDGKSNSLPTITRIDVMPAVTRHCISTPSELTDALSLAATNEQSDHIRLVSGHYQGNFKLLRSDENSTEGDIIIEGGYNADCSEIIEDKALTVIDGNNEDAAMVIFYEIAQSPQLSISDYEVIIRNMTFTRGNNHTTGGGGLGIKSNVNVLVDSVAFHDNKVSAEATQSDLEGGGGLAINTLGHIKVTASVFTNNSVKEGTWGNEYGGGLALSGFQGVELSLNVITGNKAAFVSGADVGTRARLTSGPGEVIIANNTIQGNIATNGGNENAALYFSAITQAHVFGNLITDNVSYNYTRGGARIGNAGIYTTANHWSDESTSYFIENNTVMNNVTYFDSNNRPYTNSMGIEITWMVDDFNLTLQNNIFSGNVRKDRNTGEEWQQNIALENDADDNFVSSNIIWRHNSYPLGTASTEIDIEMIGDVELLPSYLDSSYKPTSNTPLIDAGVSTVYNSTTDAQGKTRVVGSGIDLGALESQN